MTKNKSRRNKQSRNKTFRKTRHIHGSGVGSSKSTRPKHPMEELNEIDNAKHSMVVYQKLVAIKKMAPGTISIDFSKDPASMSIKELKASLELLGIQTSLPDRPDIEKLLKTSYKETANPKIDKLLEKVIAETREKLVKELQEQEEKQRQIAALKRREYELREQQKQRERAKKKEEQKRIEKEKQQERAIRDEERRIAKEKERIAAEQAEIDALNARMKWHADEERERLREEYPYRSHYSYRSHYPSCVHCPHCSHCSHRSYSPRVKRTVITGKATNGVYEGYDVYE